MLSNVEYICIFPQLHLSFLQASSGGGAVVGAPDLWSEPKVFGPRAEFRLVSSSSSSSCTFSISFEPVDLYSLSLHLPHLSIHILCGQGFGWRDGRSAGGPESD